MERQISGKILGGGYKGTAEYERQQQAARDRAAAIEQKKAEAEGRRIEGAIMGAYGLDTMEGKKYGLEAEMLGMGTPAYMDYVTTGNPEGIPELGGPGSEYINPYNVYYRDELARNTAGGLPAAQQIQYGQVLAPPWHSQTGGSLTQGPIMPHGSAGSSATQGASMYIPYADALSSYKQEYQAANRPFTIGGYGAPKQSTWDQFQKEWGQTYNRGGRVAAQEGGLMDLGGMEKDYRQEGGFVPIGGQEKADDVPARLSKNEFVFTADAVRAAGGGDIDAGAEVMENVMENLEAGGKVSEESQGLEGARNMFANAQQLEKRII